MADLPFTQRRWTRKEYDHVVALGVFADEHLELIGGELIVAEPQSPYHASGISVAEYAIRAVLPPGWMVRTQAPVAVDDESEPEPDVAVVPGGPRDYRHEHPALPVLAVEVAESSVAFDRGRKGSLYARAGLAEYWLINLVDRALEVYRDPVEDPSSRYGWRYRSVRVLAPPARVAPLAFPSIEIAVGDLLP
jgi:Uma2 family endonuclease